MHRHDDIGYWKVVKCSEQMSYICETPRQGYTEPPTTTTTIPPESQCPPDWLKYNEHCYNGFEESETSTGHGLTFDDARNYCQVTFGGDLVSFGDADEEANVNSNVLAQYYWIGFRQDNEVKHRNL